MSNTGSSVGCCRLTCPGTDTASPQLSSQWLSGSTRSQSAVVSSGTLLNDTLKATLPNASAKAPAAFGVVWAGLACRTNASGTDPAVIFFAAASRSAYDERPLYPAWPLAGLMVTPTLPAFLLMSATITPHSTASAVVTPQMAITALPAPLMAAARASIVAAGTPEASEAAATEPCH